MHALQRSPEACCLCSTQASRSFPRLLRVLLGQQDERHRLAVRVAQAKCADNQVVTGTSMTSFFVPRGQDLGLSERFDSAVLLADPFQESGHGWRQGGGGLLCFIIILSTFPGIPESVWFAQCTKPQ